MIKALQVGLLAVLVGFSAQHVHAQSWGSIGTTGTLTNNRLCYTDETDIICDGSAPLLSEITTATNAWTVDGSNIYRSSGNVGIGTTSPGATLDVSGSMRLQSSTNYANLTLRALGNDVGYISGEGGTRSIYYHARSSGAHLFRVNNESDVAFAIQDTGNVGVGTTSPSTALDVSGTVTATAFAGDGAGLTNVTATPTISGSAGQVLFNSDGSTLAHAADLYWDVTDGSLGVNTGSNPWNAGIDIYNDTQRPAMYLRKNASGTNQLAFSPGGANSATNVSFNLGQSGTSDTLDLRMWDGTASSTILSIPNTGNVGIGIAAPANIFHVQRDTAGSGRTQIEIQNDDTSGGSTGLVIDSGTYNTELYTFGNNGSTWLRSDGPLNFRTDNADVITFQTNATDAMRINSSGHLGVGTITPSARLHLNDEGVPVIFRISSDSDQYGHIDFLDDNGNDFHVGERSQNGALFGIVAGSGPANNTGIIMNQDGQVGILQQPTGSATLDVSGTVTADSIAVEQTGPAGILFSRTSHDSYNLALTGTRGLQLRNTTSDYYLMTFDDDTDYIGIGTQTPSTALDVSGTVTATAFVGDGSGLTGITAGDAGTLDSLDSLQFLRSDQDDTVNGDLSFGSALTIKNDNNVGTAADIEIQSNGAIAVESSMYFNIDSNNDTTGAGFFVGSNALGNTADRLFTISELGRVGIGTHVPSTALDIREADSPATLQVVTTTSTSARYPTVRVSNFSGSTGGHPTIQMTNARGASGAQTALLSGDLLGTLIYNGAADASTNVQGARISGIATGNWSATSAPTTLSFLTTDVDSTTYAERMRIRHDGYIGIGTTNPTSLLDIQTSATNNGLEVSDGTVRTVLYSTGGNRASLWTTTNHALTFGTNNAEVARFDTSGNLGIGTVSPNASLHVAGPVLLEGGSYNVRSGGTGSDSRSDAFLVVDRGDAMYFEHNGYLRNLLNVSSAGEINIGQDSTSLISAINLMAGNTGGVGINKTNPSTALDVSGTVTATAFAGDGSSLTGVTASSFDPAGSDKQLLFNSGGNSVAASSQLYWDETNDRLGYRDSSPDWPMDFSFIQTVTSSTDYGIVNRYTVDVDATSTASHRGMYNYMTTSASGSNNIGTIMPVINYGNHNGSGTVSSLYGSMNQAYVASTGNVTTAYGAYNQARNTSAATGTITGSAYGAYNMARNDANTAMNNAFGAYNYALNNSPGSMNIARGTYNYTRNNGTGTIAAAYGSQNVIDNSGAGTITTAYGLRTTLIDDGGGSVGTYYGLYVNDASTLADNSWGVFVQGDRSYFGGNVGIGTVNPAAKFHIAGTSVDQATISNSDLSKYHIALQMGGNTTGSYEGGLVFSDNGSAVSAGLLGVDDGDSGAVALSLFTGSNSAVAEAVRIDSLGNVGIGATAPDSLLTVQSAAETEARIRTTAAGDNAILRLTEGNDLGGYIRYHSSSHILSLGVNDDNSTDLDVITLQRATGNVGIGTTAPNANLTLAGSNPNELTIRNGTTDTYDGFLLSANNANSSITMSDNSGTRMFFDTTPAANYILDGNFGIGTNSPSYTLHVAGAAAGTTWTNLSDRRHKKNITDLSSPLEKIRALRGVSYEWKDASEPALEGTKLGVIAQEVEAVYPEVVVTGDDGTKRVDYQALVAPLIEAVKAQQQQIDALQAEINELKNK